MHEGEAEITFGFGPGGPALRPDGFHLTEVALVLTGLKPVLYATRTDSNAGELEALRLHFGLKSFAPERPPRGVPKGDRALFLAKDEGALRAAAAAWSRDVNGLEWGLALGYPRCCVEAYRRRPANEIVKAAARAAGPGPWPFAFNNLFNFFSRLRAPLDIERADALMKRNVDARFNTASLLQVLPWHVCAYDCPESARRAQILLEFLKRNIPELAERLEAHLRRLFLFVSDFEFTALEEAGDGRRGLWRYAGVHAPPYTLLEESTLAALRAGDVLRQTPRGVSIRKGGRALLHLPGARVLDFRGTP